LEIHTVDVPVLVPVRVLEVKKRLVVFRPEVLADAPLLVGGDRLVVLLADRSHPDLQDVLGIRRDPGEAPGGRGEPGLRLLRVAEEDVRGDQRRKLGDSYADSAAESEKRRENDAIDETKTVRSHAVPPRFLKAKKSCGSLSDCRARRLMKAGELAA